MHDEMGVGHEQKCIFGSGWAVGCLDVSDVDQYTTLNLNGYKIQDHM